ncbi:DUF362 domain-containing protein [Oscillospiraceae bacterium OttesenSCG-928-G22]|nr:DUF362 domain-containing protein [Oscillospiraceae bacterium OttesenSCG-928-G22]
MDGTIYTVYGRDGAAMAKELLAAANIAAEIPEHAVISLKPNLVTDSPAANGATTHPEILAGIIEYLFENGRKNVRIIEGSWVGTGTGSAFAKSGLAALGKRYSVPLFDTKKDETVAVDTPEGPIKICKLALESDYLINLPVLKGHCQTVMTCALKNLKGVIPDSEKRRFHTMGLHRPIAALAAAVRPHLTIVDSLSGDLTFEEGGNPVETERMMLGRDPVKLDVYGCHLMGIDPMRVGYIPLAEKYGAGSMALAEGDIVELNRPTAPQAHRRTGLVETLTKRVTERAACSACYGNLVHALYRLSEEGRGYRGPVCIGQEFQGKSGDVGIGLCCKNFVRSARGCPPTAAAIKAFLSEGT